VRSTTSIARGSTSLSHVAVELAAGRSGGSLEHSNVVVVGAGEIGEGIVEALAKEPRPASIVVANRTKGRAATLADSAGGRSVGLTGLPKVLLAADVVMVSTGSSLPIIDSEHLRPAAELHASVGKGPLVVVDLSVPRNVDPAVRQLDGVELLDMDDLRSHAQLAVQGRMAEVSAARDIIAEEVEEYRSQGRARSAAPVVSALRGHLEEIRRLELQRHRLQGELMDEEQWSQVEEVTRSVLAKIMHSPTVILKETAGTPRGDRLVEALRILFDLS
jgi:glutamyl-tRNA reductase